MEHPFLPSNSLSGKSLDELQTTITELTKKLTFAYRTQNAPLVNQLQMFIQSHRTEYNRRMDELISKQNMQTKIKIEKEN